MSLLSRLREKQAGRFATATLATVATQAEARGRTVASVASVAVAKSPQGQIASRAQVGADDPATGSRRWLVHFIDREPLTVAFAPPATHAEVLEACPAALAAEPIEPGRQQPDALLASDQEAVILAWLAQIGEADQTIIDDVLTLCRQDADARQHFLDRARECITPKPISLLAGE